MRFFKKTIGKFTLIVMITFFSLVSFVSIYALIYGTDQGYANKTKAEVVDDIYCDYLAPFAQDFLDGYMTDAIPISNFAKFRLLDDNGVVYEDKGIDLSKKHYDFLAGKSGDQLWVYQTSDVIVVKDKIYTIEIYTDLDLSNRFDMTMANISYDFYDFSLVSSVVSILITIYGLAILLINAGKDENGLLEHSIVDYLPSDLLSFLFFTYLICAFQEPHPELFLIMPLCISLYLGIIVSQFSRKKLVATSLLNWAYRLIRKLFDGLLNLFKEMAIVPKVSFGLMLLFMLELFFFAAGGSDVYVFFWLVSRIVIFVLAVGSAASFNKLLITGKRLAEGDLEYQCDSSRMHFELKEHAENLSSIKEGINKAVIDKTKSERMKTELIANVSHDIKTPLTSIINYGNLIASEVKDDEKLKDYCEVLTRQSVKLKRLLEDLVELSKANSGAIKMDMQDYDVNIFVSQIIGEYTDKFASAGLQIVPDMLEEPLFIKTDNRKMLRVFDNLMNNIAKYGQSGTRVYITTRRNGIYTEISFKNTSRDQLNVSADELTERFVRGDHARSSEGNGLGLSIARSFTELQGGKMTISIDGDLFKVKLSFLSSH